MELKIDKNIDYLNEIKGILKGGHVLVLYSECHRLLADHVIADIDKAFRITRKELPSKVEVDGDVIDDIKNVEEDVRLIISIGGHNVTDIGKIIATMLGISNVAVLGEPHVINANKGYFVEDNAFKVIKTCEPKLVLAPSRTLMRSGNFSYLIASLAEHMLVCFDEIFVDLVAGKGMECACKIGDILGLINSIDETKPIEILEKSYIDNVKTSDIVSEIAEQMARHNEHDTCVYNYKFAIVYAIILLYKCYIEYDGEELIYPPDISASAQIINKKYNVDISESLLRYRIIMSRELMKIKHIVREYRIELSHIVADMVGAMERMSRIFRRLSRDAGYDMYSHILTDELMQNISIFSIYETQNTPLRVIKADGMLERYIA